MPPFTKVQQIWMNGQLVPWDDATVHVSAHALQYGTGVFEGMRSYDTPMGPAIFRLDAHMARFIRSAGYYELTIPYSIDQLCAGALDVVRANKLENAYLRPLALFDSYSFAVWPKDCPVSVAVLAVPGKVYLPGGPEHGVRMSVSTVRRIDALSLPPHVKACGHYTNSVRAVQEAMRRGFDDAILLNTKGDVSEASGANLFVVRDGTVITNDMDASILMGITRDSVITLARDLKLPVSIRPILLADLEMADELFLCGTAVEITPVKEVDGRVIGDGRPGSITKKLQQTFQETVHGKLSQYRSWLAPVNAD